MERIHLDHAAATPLRPEAREVLLRHMDASPGNPSSPHAEGRQARAVLEGARRRVAAALGVPVDWIVFTRGGTESANLAVLGRVGAAPERSLVVSAVEHAAVREPAAVALRRGVPVTVLSVAPDGCPDGETLAAVLTGNPAPSLVSVQLVNSETGLVIELDELFRSCADSAVPVHVDAVQAPGRVVLPTPGRARRDGVQGGLRPSSPAAGPSLMTLSAHKLGGPRGVGLLVRDPGVLLAPLLHGGKQEAGLVPGTEDVAGAAAFAEVLELALAEAESEIPRLSALRDRLEAGLIEGVPGIRVLGADGRRAPHILGVALPDLPRDLLPGALDLVGISVSAGSACRSGSPEPSPVLAALHGPDAARLAPVRFSLGRETRAAHIDEALARAVPVLQRAVGSLVGARGGTEG